MEKTTMADSDDRLFYLRDLAEIEPPRDKYDLCAAPLANTQLSVPAQCSPEHAGGTSSSDRCGMVPVQRIGTPGTMQRTSTRPFRRPPGLASRRRSGCVSTQCTLHPAVSVNGHAVRLPVCASTWLILPCTIAAAFGVRRAYAMRRPVSGIPHAASAGASPHRR